MPFAVQPDSIEYLLETCNLSGRPIYLKFNMKNEGMTEGDAGCAAGADLGFENEGSAGRLIQTARSKTVCRSYQPPYEAFHGRFPGITGIFQPLL